MFYHIYSTIIQTHIKINIAQLLVNSNMFLVQLYGIWNSDTIFYQKGSFNGCIICDTDTVQLIPVWRGWCTNTTHWHRYIPTLQTWQNKHKNIFYIKLANLMHSIKKKTSLNFANLSMITFTIYGHLSVCCY